MEQPVTDTERLLRITSDSMQRVTVTSHEIVTIIEKLWSVYGTPGTESQGIKKGLIEIAQGSAFYGIKHLLDYCNHHDWFLPIGLSDNPKEYRNLLFGSRQDRVRST